MGVNPRTQNMGPIWGFEISVRRNLNGILRIIWMKWQSQIVEDTLTQPLISQECYQGDTSQDMLLPWRLKHLTPMLSLLMLPLTVILHIPQECVTTSMIPPPFFHKSIQQLRPISISNLIIQMSTVTLITNIVVQVMTQLSKQNYHSNTHQTQSQQILMMSTEMTRKTYLKRNKKQHNNTIVATQLVPENKLPD